MSSIAKSIVLAAIIASMYGCQDAVIISSDGMTELGNCKSDIVATCVSTYCPNGAFTLKGADKVKGDKVIRCLDDRSKNDSVK
jgi:hypothetical protein